MKRCNIRIILLLQLLDAIIKFEIGCFFIKILNNFITTSSLLYNMLFSNIQFVLSLKFNKKFPYSLGLSFALGI